MRSRIFSALFVFLLLPFYNRAQELVFSEPERSDDRDINFDIIGKMSGNYLVYKNIRWKHAISVYDGNMKLKERINLDFIPEKTFNVDFVAYPDFFYMVYQYEKRSVVHCMGVKMGADGKKLAEPVELDTTRIDLSMSNKIYSTINSEDKKHIMIFKLFTKRERSNFVTLLFNDQLQLQRKSREVVDFDDRRDVYSDFFVDNEGNFIYAKGTRPGNRDNVNDLKLVIKSATEDTFAYRKIDLQKRYLDEIKLKIDNVNKHILINAFYSTERRGNIDGLYTCIWDKTLAQAQASQFIEFTENMKRDAKKDGQLRFALNDFFIRQVIVKKDGGFLLMAEDYSSQSRTSNNLWNRYDYLNSPYSASDYYLYNSSYNPYYRPYNSFNNYNSTRYFYANVIVLSVDKNANLDWNNTLIKDQYDDENDNFMSYNTMIAGGEIQFFFNDPAKKYEIISWQSISPHGELKRNPPLKSMEKTYQFMPRFAKQVGARQLLIPCMYRGYICFAKADF